MTVNVKKDKTLEGVLLYPLSVGSRALILHEGKLTRTSRVVSIHSCTADEVCFETLNTHYRLLTGPTNQPAVSLVPTALAA